MTNSSCVRSGLELKINSQYFYQRIAVLEVSAAECLIELISLADTLLVPDTSPGPIMSLTQSDYYADTNYTNY